MQGIEYHHDTSNSRNGYDPSLPQMINGSGSDQGACLNGNNSRNNNNENYPIGNDAFHPVPSTFNDSKSTDHNMTDAMGEYSNDIDGGSNGGCNGSTEAWWTNAEKQLKKNKKTTSSTYPVADAVTSTTSTSSTANTTRTSFGPDPGPPAEANGIDRSYLYNNCASAGDHGARAAFINSTSGSARANEHYFDEFTNNHHHERLTGIINDSYSYYDSSDRFDSVNARTANVDGPRDSRIMSDSSEINYNNFNNNDNGISNRSSAGIVTGAVNGAVVTASNLSSSLSSSLSFLPTPPLTATGVDSLGLSSGSGLQFGGFGKTHNQKQNQLIYPQQDQNLIQPTQQQQQQQSQHTQDFSQQQAQSFLSGANDVYNYQELSQQHQEQQQQQQQQQQQDQYNQTTKSAHQSQGMTPTTQQGAMPTTNGVTTKSAISVACMWCRSKHLKCDGGVRCSRCQAEGFVCSYPKSRRGFKGPRKAKALLSARRHDSMTQGQTDPALLAQQAQFPVSHEGALISPISPLTADTYIGTEVASINNSLDVTLADSRLSVETIEQMPLFSTMPHLVSTQMKDPSFAQAVSNSVNSVMTFYAYYHSAHPFLPPREKFQKILRERRLPHLELAIQFISSCYNPSAPSGWFQEAADRLLMQGDPPKTGHTVQALLLFALATHANSNPEGGLHIMNTAVDLALELGMNHREFAINNGEGDPVLEESWRRTWWELFVVDGMFAAVTQKTTFRLNSIHSDVPLPCEEAEYLSGNIPLTRTLEDYDNSAFDSEETVFSSYTYRIDAIRILGKILPITDPDVMDYHAQDIADASLTNWHLHLPACKKEILGKGLEVDEILFQAHMVINGATIHLHRPRSYLSAREVNAVTTCVNPEQCLLPSQAYETHTAKAIRAAEAISKLVTLPAAISRRTPFFTCVITMSSIVHLAYWSFFIADGEDALVKEQIRLNIGGLKTLANYWPVAKEVLGQVRGVAQGMFKTKKRTAPVSFVDYVIGDEMLKGMIEDAGVESLAVGSM